MLVGINFAVKGPAFFIPLTLTSELPFPAKEWAAEASQGWHAAWAALFSSPFPHPDWSLQVALESPAVAHCSPHQLVFCRPSITFLMLVQQLLFVHSLGILGLSMTSISSLAQVDVYV